MRKFGLICLLAVLPLQASTYFYDDGDGENTSGGFSADLIHLNAFTSQTGMETIGSILVAFGEQSGTGPVNGSAVTAYFWTDPDDDGNPDDAVLLDSIAGVVAGQSTNAFVTFTLNAPVFVPAGEVFFVGVRINLRGTGQNTFLAYRDTDTNAGQSWRVTNTILDIDPNDLDASQLINLTGNGDGTFMIRAETADEIGVPEPGTFVLSLAGLGGLAFWKRRSVFRRRA